MGNITQTAANVASGAGATPAHGTAGETIVAGDVLYLKAADSELYKAINTSAAAAAAVGIALDGGGNGQPITYQGAGVINPGGTVAAGVTYCVSGTAGKIALDSDITSTMFKTVLGVGTTTSLIKMGIIASGVAIAA